jgi:HPt (histidine-containing phosphotransfer) domain-containing protein
LLGTATFDLAILDFNMGDMDGASVLQLYRFGTLEPVPAYILTADNTAATALRLVASGAVGVLHKPVDLSTLRQAIGRVFSAGPAPRREELAACQYIDQAVMADLRELGSDPIFFEQLLGTAVSDLEALCAILSEAILKMDLGTTRIKAHALKGISVSVGAVQLSSIATRLMHIVPADLHRESAALAAEIGSAATLSINSLRNQMLASGR